MPNHVLNELIVHADPALVRSKVLDSEGRIDFEIASPLPSHFWPGSVSTRHQEVFAGTHLDSARDIWGTKWNAYGHDEGGKYRSFAEGDGCATLTFQTAWSPPMGWIMTLFNTFECRLENLWLDEGRDYAVADKFNYDAISNLREDPWSREEDHTAEYRRMHKLYWGVTPEEMQDDED